ncbi:MAG: hypothetical protein HY821_11945 [Acidobacteria bacterium]|nr:hypothetical protein [Acidobacteriota bacterium]
MSVQAKPGSEALELLALVRAAERRLVSRTLHDEVGPALCSAGLMLAALQETGGETAELARSAARALEQALVAVRGLSYGANPELAMRCGLRSALQSASRTLGAEFTSSGDPPWDAAAASAAYETVRSLLLLAPGGAPRVSLSTSGIRLSGLPPLDESVPSALAASTPGLRLRWRGSILDIEAGGVPE